MFNIHLTHSSISFFFSFLFFYFPFIIFPIYNFTLPVYFTSLILGAVQNIVDIDYKKRSESERVAFNFRTKKISAYGVDADIIEEIHKFPYPIQRLIINEACAVMDRIEKSKSVPGLTSLNCHCLFRNRYLLPCKHIFHEHIYGNSKLLTADV